MPTNEHRTLLANLVNDVMIEAPPDSYARTMAAVTPRKLWLASPGDCVVTLAPCGVDFRDYVARVTTVPANTVDVVAPDEIAPEHACAVVSRLGAIEQVAARPVLTPFVLDRPVVELARRCGTRIDGYTGIPDPATLAAVRHINTKAGFRIVAAGLGLPVAEGGTADSLPDLVLHLERFLRQHAAAIVKVNRSSNGHGTFVVTADQRDSLMERLRRQLGHLPHRRCGWVYEEFLPFVAAPSVELLVDDDDVCDFYVCDQRTRDNAWTGMVTPAGSDPATAAALPSLVDAARRIGQWLHERGYRGYLDVDCGLTTDGYVVTEANVRRTGGTYLEELTRRLHPGGGPVHWRSDARPGATRLDFAGALRAIDRANIGVADGNADARALLLVDTLAIDGKWRYLAMGRTAASAAAVEHELVGLLELS